MEFGVFYQMPCADDQSPAGRYADTIAQAVLADELGFDTVWLAELHFNSRFSIMSAPLLVASAIAQATSRVKVGTAVLTDARGRINRRLIHSLCEQILELRCLGYTVILRPAFRIAGG